MTEQDISINPSYEPQIHTAPIYLALYAALADGKISNKEEKWAAKLTEIKSKLEHNKIKEFYEIAMENFDEKLKRVVESLPEDTQEAKQFLREKLNEIYITINQIKDIDFVSDLKESLIIYAKRVASTTENWGETLALFANPMLGAEDAEVAPSLLIVNNIIKTTQSRCKLLRVGWVAFYKGFIIILILFFAYIFSDGINLRL